ncbi:MAG: FixH family protein [Gammaproteobacteria bacterium]|nr:FixH family protein [Gammaproteobacteria bacterium]MDH5591849.1 FixH family protein [Gammaproteobacteria bacterium]
MNISQKNSEALKNPWVLGMLVFLMVFLTANAIFIYLAFKSPPNLVVKDFYERGERYEETQKRIEQEKSLGWNGMIMVPANTRVNQVQSYEVLIQGRNSVGLNLDSVTFNAYRPSDAKADFSVDMSKKMPGMYVSDVSFNLPGIWDLIVVAKQGEQEFVVTKRVSILP